jgi:WD40 repeat protein
MEDTSGVGLPARPVPQAHSSRQADNPFPGLRPFDVQDSHLFFGREGQSDELLRRLSHCRFLAVSGISGSGKSSLVRAGLLPELHGGLAGKAGSSWRVCISRPGDDPIGNLARALANPEVTGRTTQQEETIVETVLRRGPRGLITAVREARLNENLLVVVDQFEEIFRFESQDAGAPPIEDAAGFVELLLESTANDDAPIYVVITLRSEFLGKCSRLRGLPEAINQSQYLVPRMTREERKRVLTGPVAVGGGDISARLVQRILNEWGEDPDRLPVVQHALMRTWDRWASATPSRPRIDFDSYDEIGGLENALSTHADEAFGELSPARAGLAERIFKALTERTREGADIRRPTTIQHLSAICDADPAEVIAVVEVFRREDRSFLTPAPGVPLDPGSRIDLSHESLMLRWRRLHTWLNEETESRRTYQRLAESAVLHREGKAGWLPRADLRLALEWKARQRPNRYWAQRYHPEFQLAIEYLEKRRAHAAASRRYQILIGTLALLAGVLALSWWQSMQSSRSLEQRSLNEARRDRELAAATARTESELRKAAEAAEKAAEAASADADTQRQLAVARQLGAQARAEIGSPARSAMLALLSLSYHPSVEADNTIRHNLPLLPKRALEAHYPGEISALTFLNGAGLLAVGGAKGVRLLDSRSGKQVAALLPDVWVKSLVASPDGAMLAILAASGPYIWDVKQHRLGGPLTDEGTSIAFSPDSMRVVIVARSGQVVILNASTGVAERVLAAQGPVTTAAFSPDGRWVAVGGAGLSISAASGAPLVHSLGDQPVVSLEWSPDSSHVAVRTLDGRFQVAGLSGPANGFNQVDRVTAAAFSQDGSRLATGNAKGVTLWHVASASELLPIPHPDTVASVAFVDGDKSVMTTCADGATRVFAADTGALLTVIESDTVSPRDVRAAQSGGGRDEDLRVAPIAALGPDHLIATSRYGFDGKLRIWSRSALAGALFSAAIPDVPNSIAYTPDGSRIALTLPSGRIQLLDARTGVPGQVFQTDGQRLTEIDSSGRNVVVTTMAGAALITLGNTAPTVQVEDSSLVLTARVTGGGKGLVWVRNDGTVKRWPMMSHGRFTASDVLGPDCYGNPSATRDERILRLSSAGSSWQTGCEPPNRNRPPSDELTPAAFQIQRAALSAGSLYLAYAKEGSISLVNLDRPQTRTLLTQKGVLTALAISDDGQQVAAASDKAVRVWNADGAEALKVDGADVTGLAFSPDRRYLLVATRGQISAWYLRQGDMTADVCARLTRNLQSTEWQSSGTSPPKVCRDLP